MDQTGKILVKETEKWRERLERDLSAIKIKKETKEVKEQPTNVRAYLSDCMHFLTQEDYIRSFKAVVYAWGIFETLLSLHLIKDSKKD